MTDATVNQPNVTPAATPVVAPVAPPAAPTSVVNQAPAVAPVTTPVVEEHTRGKYTVKVIREKCISAGSCVAIAPGTFVLDEEGIAKIVSQTGDDAETQLLGAQSCPTAAIEVIDNETGEKVWPL